ncbi:hypothetical protein IWZ03DRAFT_33329 [Phyllosticta citriasiana]|uniref:Uncharacterized protein n=1 Tax=Phyllosticta citriasiana TaxID=595635 RepID=A0ABR1L114_9PEZI
MPIRIRNDTARRAKSSTRAKQKRRPKPCRRSIHPSIPSHGLCVSAADGHDVLARNGTTTFCIATPKHAPNKKGANEKRKMTSHGHECQDRKEKNQCIYTLPSLICQAAPSCAAASSASHSEEGLLKLRQTDGKMFVERGCYRQTGRSADSPLAGWLRRGDGCIAAATVSVSPARIDTSSPQLLLFTPKSLYALKNPTRLMTSRKLLFIPGYTTHLHLYHLHLLYLLLLPLLLHRHSSLPALIFSPRPPSSLGPRLAADHLTSETPFITYLPTYLPTQFPGTSCLVPSSLSHHLPPASRPASRSFSARLPVASNRRAALYHTTPQSSPAP